MKRCEWNMEGGGGSSKNGIKLLNFINILLNLLYQYSFFFFPFFFFFMLKYVYEKKTDTELQFWPHLSREIYFSKPFVDVAQINKNKNLVSCPPDSSIDYLRRHGIMYAAVASH